MASVDSRGKTTDWDESSVSLCAVNVLPLALVNGRWVQQLTGYCTGCKTTVVEKHWWSHMVPSMCPSDSDTHNCLHTFLHRSDHRPVPVCGFCVWPLSHLSAVSDFPLSPLLHPTSCFISIFHFLFFSQSHEPAETGYYHMNPVYKYVADTASGIRLEKMLLSLHWSFLQKAIKDNSIPFRTYYFQISTTK